MTATQSSYRISLNYIGLSIIAVLLTFAFHEGAHYIAGNLLGYDMWYSLNAVGLAEGNTYDSEWHEQLVSIAGPLFTIIQGIIFFIIIKRTKQIKWYPFLFMAALMRVFATFLSVFTNPNDEARVSEWLGIGKLTLHIIVSLFLIYLVVNISKEFNITWKFNLVTYAILSLGITAIVFTNQYIINQSILLRKSFGVSIKKRTVSL